MFSQFTFKRYFLSNSYSLEISETEGVTKRHSVAKFTGQQLYLIKTPAQVSSVNFMKFSRTTFERLGDYFCRGSPSRQLTAQS